MRQVSFEGTDTQRTVALRCRLRRWGGRLRRRLSSGRRVVSDVFQEGRGGHEEQIAGLRDAEIEQTIVIALGTADEHVLQHLLDPSRRTCIADEIGAELL